MCLSEDYRTRNQSVPLDARLSSDGKLQEMFGLRSYKIQCVSTSLCLEVVNHLMRPSDLKSADTFDWHDSPLDLLKDLRDNTHWKLLLRHVCCTDFDEINVNLVLVNSIRPNLFRNCVSVCLVTTISDYQMTVTSYFHNYKTEQTVIKYQFLLNDLKCFIGIMTIFAIVSVSLLIMTSSIN